MHALDAPGSAIRSFGPHSRSRVERADTSRVVLLATLSWPDVAALAVVLAGAVALALAVAWRREVAELQRWRELHAELSATRAWSVQGWLRDQRVAVYGELAVAGFVLARAIEDLASLRTTTSYEFGELEVLTAQTFDAIQQYSHRIDLARLLGTEEAAARAHDLYDSARAGLATVQAVDGMDGLADLDPPRLWAGYEQLVATMRHDLGAAEAG